MKKLALFLGSLLVVGTAVQAKEVVVAPTEVSKEIIVVAEPVVEEVVVVTPEEFKPTGYLSLEYRYYGKTEGHGDRIPMQNPEADQAAQNWNQGSNKYARFQTLTGVQATEKLYLEARTRSYNSWEQNDENHNKAEVGTQTRLRAYYKHDDLLTSRLEYKDNVNSSQFIEYQLRTNLYKNEGGLLSSAIVAPKYSHVFPKSGDGSYTNTVGVDVELLGNLPLGFTWENNYYFDQNFYGDEFVKNDNGSTKKREFVATVEFYLYNTVALWSNDTTKVNFNFEGGYDPYVFSQYNRYTKDITTGEYEKSLERTTYSLYTTLTLDAEYKVTETLAVNVGAGAEYRNWDNIEQSSASHWRWQPVAYAGMKVTF